MKRIPIVAALALAVVLFAVTKLATVTRAYGPCFHSCSSAQVYLDELHRNCTDSVNPSCNPQFGGTAVQAVMVMEDTCISAAGAAGIVPVVGRVAAVKSTLTILRANRLD